MSDDTEELRAAMGYSREQMKESFDRMDRKAHREAYEEADNVTAEPTHGTSRRVSIREYDTDQPGVEEEVDRLRSAYQSWQDEHMQGSYEADMRDDGVEGDWKEYANDPDHEIDATAKGVAHSSALDKVYEQKEDLGHDFSPAAVYRFCEETDLDTPAAGLFIQAASRHSSDDAQVLPDLSEKDVAFMDGIGYDNQKTLILEGAPDLGSGRYNRNSFDNRSQGDLIFLDRDHFGEQDEYGNSRNRDRMRDREGENVYVVKEQVGEGTYEVTNDTKTAAKAAIQATRTETRNVIEAGRELLGSVLNGGREYTPDEEAGEQ